jgi:hypothetical protein
VRALPNNGVKADRPLLTSSLPRSEYFAEHVEGKTSPLG